MASLPREPSGLADLPRPTALVVGAGGMPRRGAGRGRTGAGGARGFVPDLIVGTSIGALNGCVMAAHPGEATSWLRHVWSSLSRRRVYARSFSGPRPRGALFSAEGLRALIQEAGLPAIVEDLPLPFRAVATDLVTGGEVSMGHGSLTSALLARAAIPSVLPPVEREGRVLVDGGVAAYLPARAALRCGAASVVAASSGPENHPLRPALPRRATSIAARAGLVLLHHQIERDLHEVASTVPTVVLPPGIEERPHPWDFSPGRPPHRHGERGRSTLPR
jgi:NTE family protein